jgi:hypothetical protein
VREQTLGWLVGLLILLTAGTGAAHACVCEAISPAQGFARAQYVFTGKVVDAAGHTWVVDVDRVWKGADKLTAQVRLLDVYNGIDCEFYFEPGRTYPLLRRRREEQSLRVLPTRGLQLDARTALDAGRQPAWRDLARRSDRGGVRPWRAAKGRGSLGMPIGAGRWRGRVMM